MGQLQCKAIHQPSGAVIATDAPTDIGGKGEAFSPTDLLGCSLATCIATTMGIYAQRKGWDLAGMRLEVEKRMTDQPSRRIGCLQVTIWISHPFSDEDKQTLERVAQTCPVHKSLHPDVEVVINFRWGATG